MSATARAAAPTRAAAPSRAPHRRTPPARPRPQLHAVPRPAWRAPLVPFVLVAIALVVAGLLGLLMLNTLVAQDSFRVRQLERDTTLLREQEQQLLAQVAGLDAPEVLAQKAESMGLVPAAAPAFIEDGEFLGDPAPAVAAAPTAERAQAAPPASTTKSTKTKPATGKTTKKGRSSPQPTPPADE